MVIFPSTQLGKGSQRYTLPYFTLGIRSSRYDQLSIAPRVLDALMKLVTDRPGESSPHIDPSTAAAVAIIDSTNLLESNFHYFLCHTMARRGVSKDDELMTPQKR